MAPPPRTIVEQFEAPLLRYATRIVGDPERARDVVQDTFLRLHEKNPGLEGKPLRRWLFTVCRNRAIDLQRQQKRWQPLDPAREESVDPRGVEARSVVEVLEAVEELPAQKKEVVRLRLREGRSYAEISERTGLTVNHVGVVLHHAVRQLRARWTSAAVVAGVVALVAAAWWSQQRAAPQALRPFSPPAVPAVFVGAPAPPKRLAPEAPREVPAPPEERVATPAPLALPPSAVRPPPATSAPTVPPRAPERWQPRQRAIDVADPWAN